MKPISDYLQTHGELWCFNMYTAANSVVFVGAHSSQNILTLKFSLS